MRRTRRRARTAASLRPKTVTKAKGALRKGARMRSEEDALGSYTGVPSDGGDMPVQDADDL